MKRSAWNYYGVRIIYQAVITGSPLPERIDENYTNTHTFYEESIMLVHAQSFDHAYTTAQEKLRDNLLTHRNPYGQTVEWKLVDLIDCFLIDNKLTNGIEIYSSITPVEREVTPEEYLMKKYEYSLNSDDWNNTRQQKSIRLQTVLTEEAFSKWRNTHNEII